MNGFDLEIVITKFVEGKPKPSLDEPTMRLVCETSKGQKIVFWGSQDLGSRNIDALKNQKLPLLIECQAYESDEYMKRKYNVVA